MNTADKRNIAVLGAGSWGTALAILLARNGAHVRLWGNEPEPLSAMQAQRENRRYLPGVRFPDSLQLALKLDAALKGAQAIVVVVPSHAFRAVMRDLVDRIDRNIPVAWGTKGLEMASAALMHQVFQDVMGTEQAYAVLSGPTFAGEVARGLPSAITVAAQDHDCAADIAALLHNDSFRVYTSTDVVGVQLGGAVKNVLAIAAGISDGLGFGANARAALITRGLAEMFRLGVAMGGQQETFMGLAGLGDLVLTCTDDQSRNRRFGLALAAGKSVEQAKRDIDQVVEGIQTAKVVMQLAVRHGVEMPITEQVHAVLYADIDARDAVQALFAREQKAEFE